MLAGRSSKRNCGSASSFPRAQDLPPRDWFLGRPALQGVFLNGWVSAADLQVAGDSARRQLVTTASMQERFSHLESIEVVNQDRTPAGYSVLDTQNFARRVRSLKRLSWLKLVNGSNTVATLLNH